jgi:hypothetical protein
MEAKQQDAQLHNFAQQQKHMTTQHIQRPTPHPWTHNPCPHPTHRHDISCCIVCLGPAARQQCAPACLCCCWAVGAWLLLALWLGCIRRQAAPFQLPQARLNLRAMMTSQQTSDTNTCGVSCHETGLTQLTITSRSSQERLQHAAHTLSLNTELIHSFLASVMGSIAVHIQTSPRPNPNPPSHEPPGPLLRLWCLPEHPP